VLNGPLGNLSFVLSSAAPTARNASDGHEPPDSFERRSFGGNLQRLADAPEARGQPRLPHSTTSGTASARVFDWLFQGRH
jgi:hypothetical protein